MRNKKFDFDPQHFTGEKILPINGKAVESYPADKIIPVAANVSLPEHQKSTWRDFLITEEPADTPPLIKFQDIPICTPYNHSLLVGKKKSRKTLFIVWVISQYKRNIETDILICDTEQGKKHVWKTRDRIYRLTGKWVDILSLRGLNPDERRNVIEEAISEGKFKLVVIDGIRDLLSNINDPDQCTDLVTWIEKLTANFGTHIINVLHLNKTDNNARGHIGSELLNKAEVTIELELDEKARCTLVKCESSRDMPFEGFAFTHNAEGLPEIVSIPIKGQVVTEYDQKLRLEFVFAGEVLKHGELIEGMKIHFEVGKDKAKKLLGQFERLGWIVKNGKDRSPNAVYKLMVEADPKPQNQPSPVKSSDNENKT